jgi:hypothetical protein
MAKAKKPVTRELEVVRLYTHLLLQGIFEANWPLEIEVRTYNSEHRYEIVWSDPGASLYASNTILVEPTQLVFDREGETVAVR